MSFRFQSIFGLIPILLISTFATGCATSGNPNAGSFVKVPPHETKKKKDDVSPNLKLKYAEVLMRDERYSEARKAYKEVLAKDPQSVEAVLGIARLDQLAMRPEAAEEGYRTALKLAPNSPQVVDVVGDYYASLDRFAEAAELFEQAIELDPDQKVYHYHLAVALARDSRVNEALPHFNQSVGAAAGHYNVGRILYDQKRLDESEQQFILAMTKDPRLTEAQQWLNEVRRQRDGDVASRHTTTTPEGVAANHPAVARTAAIATSNGIPQVSAASSSTHILPGGTPAITHQAPLVNSPTTGVPAGANSGEQIAVTPQGTGSPTDNLTQGAATSGMSPAQLEQMRNQQLRSQQNQGNPTWNPPRSY